MSELVNDVYSFSEVGHPGKGEASQVLETTMVSLLLFSADGIRPGEGMQVYIVGRPFT